MGLSLKALLPVVLAWGSALAGADDACTYQPSLNLLQNPSFETGDLSGWTKAGIFQPTVRSGGAADGNYYL